MIIFTWHHDIIGCRLRVLLGWYVHLGSRRRQQVHRVTLVQVFHNQVVHQQQLENGLQIIKGGGQARIVGWVCIGSDYISEEVCQIGIRGRILQSTRKTEPAVMTVEMRHDLTTLSGSITKDLLLSVSDG